jgi:hypothetical protein
MAPHATPWLAEYLVALLTFAIAAGGYPPDELLEIEGGHKAQWLARGAAFGGADHSTLTPGGGQGAALTSLA